MDEAGNNDTAINNTSQASAQQHVEITAGELLKAMLENRPLTLLERRPQASRRVPVQLRLI